MPSQDQINDVIKQNKYTNVTLYHDNGIEGKQLGKLKGKVLLDIDGGAKHDNGLSTLLRINQIAPEANVILTNMSSFTKDGQVYTNINYMGKDYTLEEFIKEFNVKGITRSLGGGSSESTIESTYWKSLRDKYNLIIFQSAGNKDGGIGGSIPHDASIWVTGVSFGRKDKIIKSTWSASGEQIDLATFSGWLEGTSFCSPALLAQVWLLMEHFDVNMSQAETMEFLKMITEKTYGNEHDDLVGYGLPILPPLDKKYITMTTTSNKYYINGVENIMDISPVNITIKENNEYKGYVHIPLRTLGETLGFEFITTYNKDKSIHIVAIKDNTKIVLDTDSKIAFINDKQFELPVAPFLKNNRALVWGRFLAEAFNCKVGWVQSESKILILQG